MNNKKKYICNICGWIYDPATGVPTEGIHAGIDFKDLPDSFVCPECGVGKDQFTPLK
jgi:rubredoxin